MDRKREFLVKLSKLYQTKDEKFLTNLMELYNIPKEVKSSLKCPTHLFHYLDLGGILCMKTLCKNLKTANLITMSDFVEEYIDEEYKEKTFCSKTVRIMKILKEGLTNENISDLSYMLLFDGSCSGFEDLILNLFFRNKFKNVNLEYILNSLIIIGFEEFSYKLNSYFKQNNVNTIEETRRYLIVKLSKELGLNDIQYLAFLLRLPLAISAKIIFPTKLLQYIDSIDYVSYDQLKHAMEVIGKSRLLNSDFEAIFDNKIYSNHKFNRYPIVEEIKNILFNQDVAKLSFLLGKKNIVHTFGDYVLQMIEMNQLREFDINYLDHALTCIRREDLMKAIQNINNDYNNPEYNRFNAKLDIETIEKFKFRKILYVLSEKLFKRDIQKLALICEAPQFLVELNDHPIYFFHFLIVGQGLLLNELKSLLNQIGRGDLLKICSV